MAFLNPSVRFTAFPVRSPLVAYRSRSKFCTAAVAAQPLSPRVNRNITARIDAKQDEPRPKRRARRRNHGMSVVARAQQLAARGKARQARYMLRNHSTHLLHAWAVRAGRANDYDQARLLFKDCLELAPTDGVTWQAYAIMEESAGDLPTARRLFAEGANVAPECVHLWSAWGALERRQNRHEVAVGYLERAARIQPDHSNTLQMWALSCEQLGDEKRRTGPITHARELFERASHADPSHAPVWHAWATMERRERNFARARALFDAGVRADPYSAPMLRAWAEMELELGHIDSSSQWRVVGRRTRRRHLTRVGENLHMLRLLIERRSDDDVSAVMGWLHDRAEYDRGIYERLAERGEADVRGLQDMISRRSASDVRAFANWVEERYENDRRIGTHILNWDIIAMSKSKKRPNPTASALKAPAVVPQEWYQLVDNPGETLRATDERLFYNEEPVDYPSAVYFVGRIASSSGDRTAVAFALLSLSFLLLLVSAQLEGRGYVPGGSQTTENAPLIEIAPPSGVDAYLYEEEGDNEKIATAGGTIRKVRNTQPKERSTREPLPSHSRR
eukprot:IDg6864t1